MFNRLDIRKLKLNIIIPIKHKKFKRVKTIEKKNMKFGKKFEKQIIP